MKKLNLYGYYASQVPLKFDLKMKLTTLFLLVSLFTLQANNSYSQNAKLTLKLDNVPIEKVFSEIESVSKYRFFYNHRKIDLNRVVTIDFENTPLSEILESVFENTGVGYEVKRKQIILNTGVVRITNPQPVEASILVQQSVTGMVSDANGPLPGVNIVVKGTTNGVVTDFDGNYSIDNISDDDVLIFSYIGFATQEVAVNSRSTIDVTMLEDSAKLNEVVVVGYGSQNRREVTGAIASVKAKDIAPIVTGSPTTALQGRLSGVQVESFGGQPGAPTNVFVRGLGSLTNSAPLYVIDGTFASTLDIVNPNDIASIEVLKDASSAAIYGSRASNGVVIVTTKKGGYNKDLQIDFNVRGGFETASKRLDYLDSEQFLAYRAEADAGTGFTLDRANFTDSNGQLIFTDWQDEAFSTGAIQDYGISVSGGSENAKYHFSANYFDQDGILVGSGFERINARVNSEFKIGRLTVSESIGLIQSKLQENQWFGFDGAPIPILRRTNLNNLGGFEAPNADTSNIQGINNFALASIEENLFTNRSIFGNVNIAYEIIDGLTAKLNLGMEYSNGFRSTFLPTYFMSPSVARFNDNPQNDLTHIRTENMRTQIEPTLNYSKEFGNHDLDIVVGYSEIRGQFDVFGNYVGNLPNDQITTTGAAGVDNILATVGAREIDGLISGFGRINYSYEGKYLLSATVRNDASSRFAEGSRSDIFPSFSLGWIMSDEEFFPSDGVWNYFKLRGGYGELGAQNIGNYLYQSVLSLASQSSFGDAILPGFAQTSFANDALRWETSSTVNFGVDLGFFDNSLTLSAEYYKKDVQDLLVAVPIPSSNGTSIPVTQNAGSLENSGVEFELNYRKTEGDFKYDVAFNLGTLNSTLTEVPAPFAGPSINRGLQSVNRFEAGFEPGAFYGFVIDGVYDDQGQIDSDPNRTNDDNRGILTPGDFIKKDVDGDGDVDNDDQTFLGSPIPDFTYGFSLTGSYKKFDFGAFFNGVSGNEIYNQARQFSTLDQRGNKLSEVLNRWTPQNTSGTLPRVRSTGDIAGNNLPSSFFVEDGSYLRLRNLTIGYDFTDVFKSDVLKKFRLSVTGQNLFIITDYSGYDPDVSSTDGARSNENDGFFGFRPTVNSITGRGIDVRAYPNAKSVIIGLEVSF